MFISCQDPEDCAKRKFRSEGFETSGIEGGKMGSFVRRRNAGKHETPAATKGIKILPNGLSLGAILRRLAFSMIAIGPVDSSHFEMRSDMRADERVKSCVRA
jgi:hypothetical protein